ncbi:MAG TPA: oxidoreductase, partial [Xanthobacteraceae bacterium]|nr:oxidoreductase [Xanthobacteraceae bacterium]
MAKLLLIRKGAYFDSVFLMQVARQIADQPGVYDASAVMGTEPNCRQLASMGYDSRELAAAGANDLVIAVEGEEAAAKAVLLDADRWLHRGTVGSDNARLNLEEALARQADASLVVISVPGDYAAAEARKGLASGLNVFLFSSNVSVEEELALKRDASAKGLIVMGPDCGTALISGAGIGFANAVRRGPIGAVGGTGTGMQEFTCLVHRAGSGISHGIGTGSRDLSDKIGGLSTLTALDAMEMDSQTKVIVLLSKPPGTATTRRLVERLERSGKPIIACLLGSESKSLTPSGDAKIRTAATIDQAASLALAAVGMVAPAFLRADSNAMRSSAVSEAKKMAGGQRYIRGLFAGGTFCYQSQTIFRDGGLTVHSNSPLEGMRELTDPAQSKEHSLVDMGAETFVAGRPHPMIDPTLRRQRILREAADPEVALLLLDFILGAISSADPVGDLLGAIGAAKEQAQRHGRNLCVAASVCGTEEDEQRLDQQVARLESAGVLVFPTNAQA